MAKSSPIRMGIQRTAKKGANLLLTIKVMGGSRAKARRPRFFFSLTVQNPRTICYMRGSVGEHGSLISFRTGSTPATATNFVNVYSYLDPDGSDLDFKLIPLWEESWRQQGWTPRLLTIREAKRHPLFGVGEGSPQALAFAQVGGGWFSSLRVVNGSFLPRRPRSRVEIFPGGVTWASRLGVKEYAKVFPGPMSGIKIGKSLFSETGPLISFVGYDSIEEIEKCLAARKKS